MQNKQKKQYYNHCIFIFDSIKLTVNKMVTKLVRLSTLNRREFYGIYLTNLIITVNYIKIIQIGYLRRGVNLFVIFLDYLFFISNCTMFLVC